MRIFTFLLIIASLFMAEMGWGQSILTFDFASLAGNEATANSNSNDANLNSSTISRGMLTASANSGRFNAVDWATGSIANAIAGDDYMQFTITPNSNYQFSVSSIVVQWQRSATGNVQIVLRNSVDSYGSNLGGVQNVTDNTSTQTFTFTFAQSNSTSPVTYRLYSYAEGAAGSGGPGDGTGNDIVVNGSVTATAGTSTITAGAGAEPASISSLINTQGAAVLNFDMDVNDVGGDAKDTRITQMVFAQGTGNDVATWTNVIAGAELTDGTNSLTGTINAGNITFPGINTATLGLVAESTTKNYTLKVWLKTNFGAEQLTADGKNLVFRIQETNVTVDPTGSTFAALQDLDSGSGNNAIDVVATALAYVQNATNTQSNAVMTPAVTVSANDANGNRDLDWATPIEITSTGTLTGSPVAGSLTMGLATFSTLTHTVAQNALQLTATSTGTSSIGSANFNITAVFTNTIEAGAGAEPATISSIINTQGSAVLNFDILITDDGATPGNDNLDTRITEMVFTQGTGNDVTTWTNVIAGAELSDGTNTMTGTVGASTITFSAIDVANLGLVADNGTKTYTLKVWLNTDFGAEKLTGDGKNLVFRIQQSNITVDPTGSDFTTGQDQNSGSSNNAIDVTATALAYVQNASNVNINVAMTPAVTVSANDANGNRDLGWATPVEITSTGTLTGSPVTGSLSMGLATFSTLTHTVAETGRELTATSTGTSSATSAMFDVNNASSATDYFRSNVTGSGNWNVAASWQSSSTGSDPWITATLVPNQNANTITIQAGDAISTAAAVTADQIIVENSGILNVNSALTIANGSGDDIVINSGGRVNYQVSTFSYSSMATMLISTGAILSIESGSITGAGTGVNSSNHVYQDASILQWNNPTGTPSSSGVTFFPNVTSEIPIFRFASTTMNAPGAAAATVFNGVVQLGDGISIAWAGAGSKTFRNGVVGLGGTNAMTVTAAGPWIISGATASIGSQGTSLTLTNANGITISSSSASLTGSTILGASTSVTLSGTLSCGSGATLTCGTNVISGAGTFTLASGGTVKTANTTGLNGTFTVSNKTFSSNATFEFNGATQSTGALLPTSISGALVVTNPSLTTLTNNLTLTGASHSIDAGSSLTIPIGITLINNGTITGTGKIICNSNGNFEGTGEIGGDLDNDGIIGPGSSPGTVTINGKYTATPTTVHNIELASASSFDKIMVNGQANLAGTLNVTLLGGYIPTNGESFVFFTATGGINGTFTIENLPAGYSWTVTYNTNNVTLLFNGPLPVELISFNATPRNKAVELNWATGSELDNDFFAVERSDNGVDFNELTQVRGAGTTQLTSTYNFMDKNPMEGNNYYRLRQVDFNQEFSYSPVRVVKMESASGFQVFPTLVTSTLTVRANEVQDDEVTIEIISASTGILIDSYTLAPGSNELQIATDNLPAGTYMAQLNLANEVQHFMFIKN